MRRDDERLIDIRDAAQAALRFAKGRSAKDVATDELLAAALIQKITIIGEAAGRVSEARQAEHVIAHERPPVQLHRPSPRAVPGRMPQRLPPRADRRCCPPPPPDQDAR